MIFGKVAARVAIVEACLRGDYISVANIMAASLHHSCRDLAGFALGGHVAGGVGWGASENGRSESARVGYCLVASTGNAFACERCELR